jgi:hypothetical protein
MSHPEVEEQNAQDRIRVSYHTDGVEVDGSEASFPADDLQQFRFPRRISLVPFAEPVRLPPSRRQDRGFIRALTVKEQSSVMDTAPVLQVEGRDYDALQLRALVKEVTLRDPFDRIASWSGLPAERMAEISFVDTPGLAVQGSVKDEVLRHFLEKKSNHVALQLWKEDELDVVIHLVLCGRQSDFAGLWKAIERECGPSEMDDLADRLILAVNGMNLYFTNRDIKAKYTDPSTAKREGDHFATTLEDNILQKMSPRGRVRPARVCFLDSRSIVEAATTGTYAEAYRHYLPVMQRWVEPGGVGRDTLERLGLLESFRKNIDALQDPDDRGQGYLVRQLASLIEERGPRLLLRKYLVKTGLLEAIEELGELLDLYYDAEGKMNAEAVQEALRSCLAFLDGEDLESIERFAADLLDPRIEEIVPRGGPARSGEGWIESAFGEMCELVCENVLDQGRAPADVASEFSRHFRSQAGGWSERWGYTTAALAPPERASGGSAELVTHCLKVHAREILFQLLVEEQGAEAGGWEQPEEDRRAICEIRAMLDEARLLGNAACREYGVSR